MVISTATVNLQEQVYLKDLPDVQDHAGLEFIYDLVKGRGRYLCIKRLDDYLRGASQEEMPFLDEVGSDQITIYQEMLRRFSAGNWNGEVDSWKVTLTIMIGDLLQMIIGVVQIISVPFLVSVRFLGRGKV